MYDEEICKLDNVQVLKHYTDTIESSGHLYLVRFIGKDEIYRDNTIEKMAEAGIATNVHYKPLPLLTAYKDLGFDIKDYPNAYEMYKNEMTLPLNTLLSEENIKLIINTLRNIVR